MQPMMQPRDLSDERTSWADWEEERRGGGARWPIVVLAILIAAVTILVLALGGSGADPTGPSLVETTVAVTTQ